MPDSMCRLAVRHESRCVEMTLPTDAPVGQLLPAVVDLVDPELSTSCVWHLSRVGQPSLNETMSLRDSAVHDGELLLLTTERVPPPTKLPDEPCQAIIEAADDRTVPNRLRAAAFLCVSALVVLALVWSGIATHASGHVVAAAVTAVAAAFGAVVLRRLDPSVLSVVAVMFGAAAGFLAVPAGPGAPRLLLAAAVGGTTAILLHRITRCAAPWLSAPVTVGALTSAAAACGVAWRLPISTTGAVLATLSLAALGLAARFSITAAGLAPALPNLDRDDIAAAEAQAITAHRSMTGLVIGSAAAAAIGTVLVASGSIPDSRPSAVVFAIIVGLVMVLRARTHVDARRRTALVACGMMAIAAGCAIVVAAAPERAQWVCLLVAAPSLSTLGAATGNPLARRTIEVLEYAALAAVVPAACWVGGLYAVARQVNLP